MRYANLYIAFFCDMSSMTLQSTRACLDAYTWHRSRGITTSAYPPPSPWLVWLVHPKSWLASNSTKPLPYRTIDCQMPLETASPRPILWHSSMPCAHQPRGVSLYCSHDVPHFLLLPRAASDHHLFEPPECKTPTTPPRSPNECCFPRWGCVRTGAVTAQFPGLTTAYKHYAHISNSGLSMEHCTSRLQR